MDTFWLIQSHGNWQVPWTDAAGRAISRHVVKQHVVEAMTGQDAKRIARKFRIGKRANLGYVPNRWELLGKAPDRLIFERSRGQGGKIHYESLWGKHCVRGPEEIIFKEFPK